MADHDPSGSTPPAPPPPPIGTATPVGRERQWWKRPVPLWAVVLIGFVALVLGAAAASSPDEDEVASGEASDDAIATARIATLEDDLDERDQTITSLEDELDEVEATTTTRRVTTTTSTTTTAAPATAPPPPPATSATVLMPDVVCSNLQDAQNEIQRAGVYLSYSEDATGRDRNQVIDSNWLVIRQTPTPGTPIGEGDPLLYVVKYGETNDCGQ